MNFPYQILNPARGAILWPPLRCHVKWQINDVPPLAAGYEGNERGHSRGRFIECELGKSSGWSTKQWKGRWPECPWFLA